MNMSVAATYLASQPVVYNKRKINGGYAFHHRLINQIQNQSFVSRQKQIARVMAKPLKVEQHEYLVTKLNVRKSAFNLSRVLEDILNLQIKEFLQIRNYSERSHKS